MSGFRIALHAAVLMAGFLIVLMVLDHFEFFDRDFSSRQRPDPSVNATISTSQRPSNGKEIVIERAADGHFWLEAYVNDERLTFMVDTGATVVILSPRAADALGFDFWEEEFTMAVKTPTGVYAMAPVRLDVIEVGDSIEVFNVQGAVLNKGVDISLLGLSFLNKLSSYKFSGDELTLVP